MASADRLIAVFTEAKARPAGLERDRFLADACGEDMELKGQVLSLLDADSEEGRTGFLKNTLAIPIARITEKPGDRIGRYKLLQQLGEGGCGVVYMAEQEEPVRRRVALKVIKLGMDTKSVIARFEAERQALALMDHPNIAKVFDAGATETGRPFFVMELVRGIKITDYCDQNNLTTEQRLELFTQVCHAVQHAHQKGIIHRDLKPSNILVTLHDGVPVPKVIDFGVAKATSDQRLTDKTVFTAFEQFIGTPAYMSPEQAEMSGLDIDTRSDIYSLGVLLYELLTGRTPLDPEELLRSGMNEMRRKIREDEPAKPSTRLAVQPDGKILVGGFFTAFKGANRNGIARLNANGSLDSSFNPGTGVNGWVRSIVVQSDGKVLIGGGFSSFDGTNRGGIARLNANGSLDNSFNPGAGVNGAVSSVAVQADGKVLIGGSFIAVNGTNRNNIARLNADGSLDSDFNASTYGDQNATVMSVVVQSDGKVVIAGGFTTVNWYRRNRIARLNADGSLDDTFAPDTGPDNVVRCIALQPDGKVVIGGDFTTIPGASRKAMARLNADGGLDTSFHPGRDLTVPVSSIVVQPDGKVLIGDIFTFINGTNRYASTRLNTDGSLDGMFISNTNFRPDLVALNNDDCGSQSCSCTRYAVPFVLLTQPDGKVLIGGQTQTFISCDEGGDQIFRHFLARFNADGTLDGSFWLVIGNRDSGIVNAPALQPDGKVLVGGSFLSINGTNRNGIARLNANGTLDDSFNPGTGANGVSSIAVQGDGKVLIGGGFTTVNGTNRSGITRLNADGNLDSSFNPGTGVNGTVYSVALQSDGKVLIGGEFTGINGTNRNRIARLNANGSLDSSCNPGTGANGVVRSIALQPDGKVLIGGDFTSVNGVVRPRVARLYGDSIPSLSIARSNAFLIVSWPVTGLSFQLQETTDLALPNAWSSVAQSAVTNAGQISVTVPTTVGRKFFRLKSQ